MSEALKSYAKHGFDFDNQNLIFKDSKGQPFQINQNVLQFEGNTVFERGHPTFISKKRKVILTCPRKVGHSSIRFYLNYMNEVEGDDWIWIEDADRNPKNFLDKDELMELYKDLLSSKKIVNLVDDKKIFEQIENADSPSQFPYHYKSELIHNKDRKSIDALFGETNDITWPDDYLDIRGEHRYFPPFSVLEPFKQYTSYLVVRDPWDRFISGLITEMDNGLLNPWKFERQSKSPEGWEKLYNSAKRILFFTEPEYLTMGGLNGPQSNHTFLLARPLWRGKSMYDIYDNLIHYKHDISYKPNKNGDMNADQNSLEQSTGVIENLVKLKFISQESVEALHGKEKHNMHSHTHVNITPHIRQYIIDELQKDEDLKDWWDRCRELVDIDNFHLENNKHKF